MFNPGEYVVCGYSGVCKVEEITSKDVPGSTEKREYYALLPVQSSASRVFTPVDGKRTLRAVMTAEEAENLILEIPHIEPLTVINDKHREEQYKEAMRSCDYREWIRVIKTLQLRQIERAKRGKQSTAVDNRYRKTAEEYLYTELAIALSKNIEEIEDYIRLKAGIF